MKFGGLLVIDHWVYSPLLQLLLLALN